jgi:hypothetical protein
MTVFLVALAVFALAILGMSLGVLVRGRCLRGSCGGLSGMTDAQGRPICDACVTHDDGGRKAAEDQSTCDQREPESDPAPGECRPAPGSGSIRECVEEH